MANTSNPEINNSEYLKLVISADPMTPEKVLLPHEQAAVTKAYADKVRDFTKIISEKVEVTGGDDWHDGAFRATDNEAKIVTEGMAGIAPFLGATVVDYPSEDEQRVTLGSRALITQGNYTFPVDIVGFRTAYPAEVIDPGTQEDVTAASPESPLGRAIMGKVVGDETTYRSGERVLKAIVTNLSQTAVREYFADPSNLAIEIDG